MLLKTVICDDCEKARYILRKCLEKLSIEEIELIGEAENSIELIETCKVKQPDIILLDIDMPGLNGIESAKKIIEFLPNVSIIFITGYMNYAIDSFEVYPADYILKPVSIERLGKTIKKIINERITKQTINENNNIIITFNHQRIIINPNNIILIERVGRKILIHTLSKIIESYESLDSIQKRLDSEIFMRVHKGYLINTKMSFTIIKSLGKTNKIIFDGYDKSAYITNEKAKNIEKNLKNKII